jgi:para-nitrobenzyl esterase
MSDPIVTTTSGRVRGTTDDGALRFLGIPFAAPPVGEHRLVAPAPVKPWDGVRDALEYGPTAQRPPEESVGGIPEPSIPGDDYLNVNVFSPDLAARLPVLVWIHGGGYIAGCNASPWYRGTRFARDGIVVASIGYRLGAEGFATFDGAPTNRAVLDWVAALEWVQDNIAAFGGDPAQVTIGGQSAGAGACTTLLSMPRAQGLFHGVIAMSGVARASSMDESEQIARRLADHLGVAPERDALVALGPDALLEAQRAAVPAGMSATRDDPGVSTGGMPFAPVVDGDLIATKPLAAIADGIGGGIPLLAGTTSEEFVFPVALGAITMREDQLLRAMRHFGFDEAAAASYRAGHPDAAPGEVLGRVVTDHMFRVPAQRLLDARAGADAPTFAYEFRWGSTLLDGKVGSVHCLDIPFAFDNLDAADVDDNAGPNPPQALADAMHRAWTGFITHGDPGWPAHDPDRRATMLFDDESAVADDPMHDLRTSWPVY